MLVYFSILTSIFGTNAFVLHFAQVLIHIVNSCLVFIFLKRLLKEKTAIFLSIIFLVHPINTETISYISIVNDPLYFLFGMLGLIFLDKSILISGLFLLCSLLSKESGVLFLCIGILYCLLFLKKALKKVFLTYVVIFLIYLLVRIQLAHIGFSSGGFFPMERLSFGQRLLSIPSIILFYFTTFLFPLNLSIGRQWSVLTFSQFLLPLLVLLLGIFPIIVIVRKTIIKPEQRKTFLFFLGWLILGLGFYLQLFPLSMSVAERWFYLAEIGFLGILGLVWEKFYNYKHRHYFLGFLIIILFLLGVRTFIRNFDWKNDKTLFAHDIRITQDSYMIQSGMGAVKLQEKNYDEAESYFKYSLKLFPYETTTLLNLGIIYERKKDYKTAAYYFEQDLHIYPTLFLYEKLSTTKILSSDWAEAKNLTRQAIKLYPKNAKLHLNMALIFYKLNDAENAIFEINKAYQLSGNKNYLNLIKKIQNRENINIDY